GALVRDVRHVAAGRGEEIGEGEMARRAVAARGVVHLLLPGELRELGDALRRHRRVHREELAVSDGHRDRGEVLRRVEGQLPVDGRVDGESGVEREEQRVAVGGRLRHQVGADVAAGAGLVLDHEGLPHRRRGLVGDEPRERVERPGHGGDDHAHRLRRIGLRERAAGHERRDEQTPRFHASLPFGYHRTTAAIVEAASPAITGQKMTRTASSTGTRAKPVTAMSEDQAISVPPPVHTAPIWPTAHSVAGSMPSVGPSAPESAPVSGRPAKPEPSTPVIMPTISTPKATKKWLCGIQPCAAWMSSKSSAGACAPEGTPRIAPAVSAPPTKKKPAIGRTAPIALKANTKPSITWFAVVSRNLPLSQASAARMSSTVAVPPTSAAASPPLMSGMPATNLGSSIAA